MEEIPIKFQEHVQLQALGIQPMSIGFNTLTMESDKFICVREKLGEQNQVVIIDFENLDNLVRRTITADSAIMHPTQKIIALKAGKQLQIFNLGTKTKLKSYSMNEEVVFWKWTSGSNLGLITDKSVYHWSLEGNDASPTKIFDRHQNLDGNQIINYRVNKADNWMILIGRVVGAIQLYNKDRNVSQPIEAHAASFAYISLEGSVSPTSLFSFIVRTANSAKLHVVEIDHDDNNPVFKKKAVDVYFPAEAPNDFPVAMQISEKLGVIYTLTKFGFIHVFDLESADLIYTGRISGDTIFVAAELEELNGVIAVNRKGQVLSVCLNTENVIQYILNNQNNIDLALSLAARNNLPGADHLYIHKFEQLFDQGNYPEAAKVAATSPNGMLRTAETIERFKTIPPTQGQAPPILQYFGILLEKGELNKFETLELTRPVLQQGRKQLLEKWLKENKLHCSEELGDIVKPHDVTLALSIYLKANISDKAIPCFAESGQYSKIVVYSQKVGYNPDYPKLLERAIKSSPEAAVDFAKELVKNESGPLVDIERIMNLFSQNNLLQQATEFLLDALKNNRPDQGHLQTRLLEMTLLNAPQVADAILGNELFSHYDRTFIASLCERAGLVQRALEHYSDSEDIKRAILNTDGLDQQFLVQFFGKLSSDQCMEIMKEMIQNDLRKNLQICILIASKYTDKLEHSKLISLFESLETYEGLYYYLGSIVNQSKDPEVPLKYVEAAVKIGRMKDVERICRESDVYQPEKMKNFLKEANLQDLLPLIIVCDRFDFIDDLVRYLYQNKFNKYIELYVQRVNSSKVPKVIGTLMDLDADEQFTQNLLSIASGEFSFYELIDVVEKHNRLSVIKPWLEEQIKQNRTEPAIYNALAMFYIDNNQNPETFLRSNQFYEPKVVGDYCQKRDPYLAYVAYDHGNCDEELISITNENSMFKHQARYLVKRKDFDLWATALDPNNTNRDALIEQVTNSAITECKEAEDIAFTVKSFMKADLSEALIELLEKVVLNPESKFSSNKNLQNLLIMTAVRSKPNKVMDFANRLNEFDHSDVAKIAITQELYEEAFFILKKSKNNQEAIQVLLVNLKNLDRASDFAELVEEPQCWSKLARQQLHQHHIKEAVDSYNRANDFTNYEEVIQVIVELAESTEHSEDASKELFSGLMRFLTMARKVVREPILDTELIYCYAELDKVMEMETFINGTHIADLESVGEKCYKRELFDACKIIYNKTNNWGGLSSSLVQLGQYQAAVDGARKANSFQVWKRVHEACVEKHEFRLAQICGLNLVTQAEHLNEVIGLYENQGFIQPLIGLLESSLALEKAHMGIFTELACVYIRYQPESLMDHLKLFCSRLNIPKVIKQCEMMHMWPELVFLYVHYDEYDKAIQIMMKHSAVAFEHDSFKFILGKVSNSDLLYYATEFYINERPLLINDLLGAVTKRIDPFKLIGIIKKTDNLPLIKAFLISNLNMNNNSINEAYHKLLIEEMDFITLADCIIQYDNFDKNRLAIELQKHQMKEVRSISRTLYNQLGSHKKSIELSKSDNSYLDAILSACQSKSSDVVHDLLLFFLTTPIYDSSDKKDDKLPTQLGLQWFMTLVMNGYNLLKPEKVMELAWRFKVMDYVFPYFIQVMKNYSTKVIPSQLIIRLMN